MSCQYQELINIKGGVAKEGFLPVRRCCPFKTNNEPKGNQYDEATDGRNRSAQQQSNDWNRGPGRSAAEASESGLQPQRGGELPGADEGAAQKHCGRIDLQLVL